MGSSAQSQLLERAIRDLTHEVNGQFPRPWSTSMTEPEKARVFIVGYNQATGFPVECIESPEKYVDALYNRKDGSCADLYKRIRGDKGPSPTHKNINALLEILSRAGIDDVIVTNVICYSTPISKDLSENKNQGGRELGRKIFQTLLDIIRPPVLIAHGSATNKELRRALKSNKWQPAYLPKILPIHSLAPPGWNRWCHSAQSCFEETSAHARALLDGVN